MAEKVGKRFKFHKRMKKKKKHILVLLEWKNTLQTREYRVLKKKKMHRNFAALQPWKMLHVF